MNYPANKKKRQFVFSVHWLVNEKTIVNTASS